ncbi:hypothetical protein PINS_up009879 [Pythium insidiosum]|nr:hypothetical protein PINS_up009879 [Pythium insidiosum]
MPSSSKSSELSEPARAPAPSSPVDSSGFHALKTPRPSAGAADVNDQRNPLDRANWVSVMTLWWIQPLIRRGYLAPLQQDNVWDLAEIDKSDVLLQRFNAAWDRQLETGKPGFGKALWDATKKTMLTAIALQLLSAFFSLFQPIVIKALLQNLQGRTTNALGISSGYGLAFLLGATAMCGAITLHFGMFLTLRAGCNARMTVVNSVYLKILRLSATARRTMNSGEIITLASVDSERLLEAYGLGAWTLISPLTLVCLCFLIGFQMEAYVGLAAAVSICLIMYLAVVTARQVGLYRRKISTISAQRVKLTNEVLQGIRVVKFYGWEESILAQIQRVREEEVLLMRRYNYLRLYNSVLMFLAPFFVNVVCFTVYILLGNTLDLATAFVVLALTNACRMPFTIFATASLFVSEAITSIKRIGKFLVAEEVHDNTVDGDQIILQPTISFEHADFQWSTEATEPILRDLTLTIQPGSLTVIVGAVGSGKSSLINAMLGEMLQTQGKRVVHGAFSYASQQPWIQNQTLRENILFGEPFDADHYQNVITACQLIPDFEMLEQGDATEIGERGINLSGGQKARVSIARAMYRARRCDFLVMDDPLSALDVHVANAVFDEGLNRLAKGKTRLLVLNAHYHFLHYADRILVMEEGKIIGDGTLGELTDAFPFLASSPRAQGAPADAVDGAVKEPGSILAVQSKPAKPDAEPSTNKKLIVEEDRNVGSVNVQTYVRYLSCCGWDGYFVAGTIITLFAIAQVAIFMCDWFLSRWANGSFKTLDQYQSMGVYLGLIVFTAIFAFARCAFYTEMCMRCSANLHSRYLRRVIGAPVTTFFDVTPVGRILNRFSRDLDQVDNPLPNFSMWMIIFMFQIGCAFIVCAITSPYILIMYAPLSLVFIFITRYYQASARELKRLDGITRSPFINLVSETIQGIETIRSYRMADTFSRRCEDLLDLNGKLFFAFQSASRWFGMRTDWLVAVIICGVAVLSVATKSGTSAAVAGLALTYAAQLTASFQRMTNLITTTENIMTCFERISFYDSLDQEGHTVEERQVKLESLDPTWPTAGAVSFENVTMRYRSELELVLRGVSFSVQSGEKVGVCGRTGSGKSSLMSVLFRVVEVASGKVMIDGVDISTLPIPALRSKLTIIPQDPMLFSGSLRFNLDPFNEKDDAELWDALKKVHLYDVVQRWGSGLEYEIAEKGDNLSVGQRQLLCIARALIRESKVIVLDEATANVDQESDKLIQLTVRESFGGSDKTVLCIAHRLETIIHSDKILVLDSGRVAEFDSPAVLLERPGSIFRSLVESSRAVKSE